MVRPEKVQAVEEIRDRIDAARAVFLAEFAGLSVGEQQQLRRGLKDQGAEFKVVKMTLARRAVAELGIESLDEVLLGPTGLAFADDDPVSAAKLLRDFSNEHEPFRVKGGLLAGAFLTPERISELADIEPREVLMARLAGGFQAPLVRLAGLLAAMPRSFATMLSQLIDARSGEADAAEPEAALVNAEAEAEAGTAPEAADEATGDAEGTSQADEAPHAEDAEAAVEASTGDAGTDVAETPATETDATPEDTAAESRAETPESGEESEPTENQTNDVASSDAETETAATAEEE